jgi:membrane protein
VLSAAVSAFGDALERSVPGALGQTTLYVIDLALSLTLLTGVLGLIFRYLPDAKVQWREAFVGGALTALLFTLGKLAIGVYLGRSHVGSAFGAASALAAILVWIYFSSSILLFGAELTQAWACLSGRVIEPEPGAIRVQEAD